MRKVFASTFLSLDGVMQGPGGPDEDPSGGFELGGWIAPHGDETTGAAIDELLADPFDLLLGRRTYDIFTRYWPGIEADPAAHQVNDMSIHIARLFNRATKYVATHSPETLTWQNSRGLGEDVPAAVRQLRQGEGPNLLIQGSGELIRTLLAHGLIDELRLQIFPVLLGRGKRLFGTDALPAAFRLTRSATSGSGVLLATYERAGEVPTGLAGR